MNRKLLQLIENSAERRRLVQLTPNGPVLVQGEAGSPNAFESHEVDEATWSRLMDALQTGELDNAKVKKIIKAK